MSVIEDFRTELAAADERLLETAARLSDDDVHAPSLLPGWTRGHVLAHLARNADSLVNLLTWARTGVVTPQYPTPDARDAGIAAGAPRPAAEQLADLRESSARMAAAIGEMPPECWRAEVGGPPGHPAWYLLARRIREVEAHHADLGAGYGWPDWPETFVWRELHDTLLSWPRGRGPVAAIVAREPLPGGEEVHAWRGLGGGPVVHGMPLHLLAWLTGRSGGEGLVAEPDGPDRSGDSGRGSDAKDTPLPPPPPWPPRSAPEGLPADPPPGWPLPHDN
ncbi:maleylpyruvate isomerase family mycothiol-dependent enzyme [Microbispora sp. RL4-1S]|uniref:Maleylpyruvate isomerase family mycothiol-dependent enzyme n=1 Tax=Microbispora oryzae TaxID=2806554 RepID=A0A941AGY1_9ACTN|nr:maleylpyruvate isomerase family mycothiol-dependent enzyme [Microbispora oryzae]MBP2703466.1 maleylpyruvate isomerase family mycothiol-dependent enzyme [Microbispora oryzae]